MPCLRLPLSGLILLLQPALSFVWDVLVLTGRQAVWTGSASCWPRELSTRVRRESKIQTINDAFWGASPIVAKFLRNRVSTENQRPEALEHGVAEGVDASKRVLGCA